MPRRSLIIAHVLALLPLACGDDATTPSAGTTGTGETTDDPPTTVSPATSSPPGTSATTTPPGTETGDESGSSSSAETGSTTMVGPACGDGNEDPGEECDDGNTDQDDACTAMCTIAYEVEWTATYNGPASNSDLLSDGIIDGDGNVIVVGSHRTLMDGTDLWLQQYAPDGSELWNFTWDGGSMLADSATKVALHPSGDVIIIGSTRTAQEPNDDDMLVMRVPFGGDAPTWVETHDGPDSGDEYANGDYANGLRVDSMGNIVVGGNERVAEEGANVWLRKYDPDGGEIWPQTYDGAQSENDFCSDLAVDAADNIYLLCTTEEVQDVRTGWLRKYDPDGGEIWTQELPWIPNGIALDADENILLTGYVDAGTFDIIVEKYDPDFRQQWSETINGPSAGSDFGQDLVADADGNVYVAANIAVNGQQDDIYVHKFDADGADQWGHAYNNEEAGLNDHTNAVAVDDAGNVYAIGWETVLGQQNNTWLRKLVQP